MTDCVLFATLFATYAVLKDNTAGGPDGRELFSIPFILVETIILLVSSYTAGLALLSVRARQLRLTLFWLGATFLLGAAFLSMELAEFAHLVAEGHSWQRSGFLSAYFALVGTHGLHIVGGLIWLSVLVFSLISRGITAVNLKRMRLLGLFWHFLDIIWIFIFTVVYLAGVRL